MYRNLQLLDLLFTMLIIFICVILKDTCFIKYILPVKRYLGPIESNSPRALKTVESVSGKRRIKKKMGGDTRFIRIPKHNKYRIYTIIA